MQNKIQNKKTKIYKKSFKFSDQIFFAQRLSLLMNSGISIVESLSMMMDMDDSSRRKDIYKLFIEDIEKGFTLSRSIEVSGLAFNNLLTSLIKNGEISGRLSTSLSQAHYYLEKRNEIKKKIISSLIYPCFIVCATVAMTLFLILYIFPKIIPLLLSLDIDLPLITRVIQGIYLFSISYGLWFVLFIVAFVIVFRISINKFFRLKYILHLFYLRLPPINKYISIYTMSSVCSMGEILLSSGKSISDVLLFSQNMSKNVFYKKIFADLHDQSLHGVSLSNSLKKHEKFFPRVFILMCAIGEKSSSLGEALGYCSKIFESELETSIKRFSSIIEPILMIFMGLIVGSVALSIILPVYEITNHLTK